MRLLGDCAAATGAPIAAESLPWMRAASLHTFCCALPSPGCRWPCCEACAAPAPCCSGFAITSLLVLDGIIASALRPAAGLDAERGYGHAARSRRHDAAHRQHAVLLAAFDDVARLN